MELWNMYAFYEYFARLFNAMGINNYELFYNEDDETITIKYNRKTIIIDDKENIKVEEDY